jgi:hypothetical protein
MYSALDDETYIRTYDPFYAIWQRGVTKGEEGWF